MLTVEGSRETVLNAFTQGADGYLLKDSSPDQVSAAIQDVVKDGAPMSPSIARLVVGILKTSDSMESETSTSDLVVLLSQREREVLEHLAEGYRYAEIAERLSVATTTIKTHVKSIYRKLEVRNSAEAIKRLNNRS
jgi:DNA-binding NarL/FixJ family response regulator